MAKFDELEARVGALEAARDAWEEASKKASVNADVEPQADKSLESRVAELEKLVKTLRK